MLSGLTASLIDLPFVPLFAQSKRTMSAEEHSEVVSSVLFWGGMLVAFGVAFGLAGYFFYRRLKRANEPVTEEPTGFSLSEMRRLYEAGEMSHEEFVQVKERILTAARRTMGVDGAAAPSAMERVAPPETGKADENSPPPRESTTGDSSPPPPSDEPPVDGKSEGESDKPG